MGFDLALDIAPGLLSGEPSLLSILQPYIDANGGVMWSLQDTSGSVAVVYNTALAEGRDIVINGDFATDTIWTKGTGWSIAAGVASCDGSQLSTSNLTQIVIASGITYRVTFTVSNYSAGTVNARLQTTNGTPRSANGTYIEDITSNGSAFSIQADADFVGDIDNVSVTQLNIAASSAFSTPGDNPFDGTTVGATIAQPGPKSDYSYLFDGTNDYVDVYSPELNSFITPAAWALLTFVKMANAGVWTDGALRVIANLQADANNYIRLSKTTTNNQLAFDFTAGGTLEQIVDTSLAGSTGWFVAGMTRGTNLTAYINGAQVGTPQSVAGTWVGNLASTTAVIGALNKTPNNVTSGYLAYNVFIRAELSAADMLAIAKGAGLA